MQHDSDPASRARTIASNNILNALFMVLAAGATMGMLAAGFSVPHVFLTIAVINALVAGYMFKYKRENP
jgi:acyl-[acyl-carrier-protein]-phospholipid O-acyltransferase/long-chain-fatty-acid--[acyl-carrier-protein] ligase